MCRNFRLGSVCGVILLLLSSAKCQTQTERIIDPRPRLLSNSSTTISGPQARIVGGTNAQQYRYPYVVSLIAFEDSHACGGSLVAPDVVLTAAHCQGVLSRAHIGRWNRLDSSEDFDDIEVVSEIPHPGYVDEGFKSDYMVLKLATPSSKQIVRLNENSNIPRGDVADEMIAMGFGDTIFGVKSLADVLQEVSLTYVPNAVCELSRDSTLGLTYQGEIIDSMLCAGDAGEDSCQGDSGGPLIVSGGSAEQDVLVGIISWYVATKTLSFGGTIAWFSKQIYYFFQGLWMCPSRIPWCILTY